MLVMKLMVMILSNIVLSKDTLQDDIFNSSIAVYRGSSTIVTAILNGLYPIYLSKNKTSDTVVDH